MVLAKPSLDRFCSIPLKKLRADSLSELDLKDKGVGDPGALVLAHFLRDSCSLKSINLCGNNLGIEGGKAIAECIRVSCTLMQVF